MSQRSLFEPALTCPAGAAIALAGAELMFHPHAFSAAEADDFFATLHRDTAWRQDVITIHGRTTPLPRLQCWYADSGAALVYSGMQVPALALTPTLAAIRDRVQRLTAAEFNSVLVNCYRDGNDSVGWHSDDEPEWGANPVIASVSFGAARDFQLKPRGETALTPITCTLTHGSLLLMGPSIQTTWRHQLPKRKRVREARINLTFRRLVQC